MQIVDDVPTAVNDSNPTTATENNLVLNGNVITNDVQGADGAAVTAGTLSGTTAAWCSMPTAPTPTPSTRTTVTSRR
ncbi:hypothetical protein JZM63_03020 [Aeromonas caviae]|nr:hypothetical protein JZM63_03020 [Aeromonas caviae]